MQRLYKFTDGEVLILQVTGKDYQADPGKWTDLALFHGAQERSVIWASDDAETEKFVYEGAIHLYPLIVWDLPADEVQNTLRSNGQRVTAAWARLDAHWRQWGLTVVSL